MSREALFFEKKEENKVFCQLCPHHCLIPEGKSGICKARVNRGGKLYTENYGQNQFPGHRSHREKTLISLLSREPDPLYRDLWL